MLAAQPQPGELGHRRRVLAQRLHAELARAPAGGDRAAEVACGPTVVTRAAACRALELAPKLARAGGRSRLLAADGPGGRVVRLHGDSFSLVFGLPPAAGPVLVVLDSLPGFAVRVDTCTDTDLRRRAAATVAGVLAARPDLAPASV